MGVPLSGFAAVIDGKSVVWVSEKTDIFSKIADQFNLRDQTEPIYAFEFRPDPNALSPDPATWQLAWCAAASIGWRQTPCLDVTAEVRPTIERIVRRYVCTDGEQIVTCRGWAFRRATQQVRSGEARAYDHAIQDVQGGVAWAYDHVVQHIRGGYGIACDHVHQMVRGGHGMAHDHAVQDVHDGIGIAYDHATQHVFGGAAWARGHAVQWRKEYDHV